IELFRATLKISRCRAVELPQPIYERLRYTQDVVWIEMNVRIAERMDVALRPVNRGRYLEASHEVCGHEVAGLTRLQFRIARSLQQHRQPADLEVRAAADQQICRAHA